MKVFLAALILSAGTAQAALSPCSYEELIKAADTVVQIEGITVTAPETDAKACVVSGTVVHALRGEAKPGDALSVTLACEWDGMVGGTVYHDRAALTAAKMIELHLTGGEVAGYGAGLDIIDPAKAGQIAHQFTCD